MSRAELNKRLLKRANWANNLLSQTSSNEELGRLGANHAMNLATMSPSEARYSQYLEQNNLNPDDGIRLHEAGQRLLAAANNPEIVSALMNQDYDALQNNSDLQRAVDLFQGGFALPSFDADGSFSIPMGAASIPIPTYKINNPEKINDALMIAGRTGSGSDYYDAQGNLKPYESSWFNRYVAPYFVEGADSDQVSRLMPFYDNKNLTNNVRNQATGQIIQGLGQALGDNLDSPFGRKMKATLATRYMQNKIDEWAPATSPMGNVFNTAGNWLLKLLAMIPGYESIMNWLVNWQYGDKLKALPGVVQNYGKSVMYPSVSPTQSTSPALARANVNNSTQKAPVGLASSAKPNNMLPQAPSVPNIVNYQPNTVRA